MFFGCAVLWTQPSAADGALAIALPSDVVKVGFVYGTGYNYPTAGEAQQKELENCKKTKSDVRKKLCAIINTFKNQCFAVAMDPADGTPGVGWGSRQICAHRRRKRSQNARSRRGLGDARPARSTVRVAMGPRSRARACGNLSETRPKN